MLRDWGIVDLEANAYKGNNLHRLKVMKQVQENSTTTFLLIRKIPAGRWASCGNKTKSVFSLGSKIFIEKKRKKKRNLTRGLYWEESDHPGVENR